MKEDVSAKRKRTSKASTSSSVAANVAVEQKDNSEPYGDDEAIDVSTKEEMESADSSEQQIDSDAEAKEVSQEAAVQAAAQAAEAAEVDVAE